MPRIRRAREGDIAWMRALERGAFATDRISRRGFRRFLKGDTSDLLLAELAGRRAGYALLLYRKNSRIARLYSLAVQSSARDMGLGSALIAACEKAARCRGCDTLRLEVRADNTDALRLYERLGFRVFEERPDYYQDGVAALRMGKAIGVEPASSPRSRKSAS